MPDPRATIVCYHYVREVRRSRFPEIKGLETAAFREQMAYFKRFYNFVSAAQVVAALNGRETLPPRALLLTFDDGYADHFNHVLPVLVEYGASGCFFAPVQAIRDGMLLDVNRIHFALASAGIRELYNEISDGLAELRHTHALPTMDELRERYERPSKFDGAEVTFVKRVLQKGLPLEARTALARRIFHKFVTRDEVAFARELYLSEDQIRSMLRQGMHFGSHGTTHQWFDSLSPVEQEREIDQSLVWLDSLGATREFWSMCYPYGAHNDATIQILRDRDCAFALTVQPGLAGVTPANRFTLERLDTNEFPKVHTLQPNQWTQLISA